MLENTSPLVLVLLLVAFGLGVVFDRLISSGPAEAASDRVRLSEPRVAPLDEDDWTAEQAQLMENAATNGRLINIFPTLVRHPELYKSWITFGGYILRRNSLPERDRELAILRIGWLCQAEYEFGQHTVIALRSGISDDEIVAITEDDAGDWSAKDAAIIRAVDELHEDAFVTDATWTELSRHYDTKQLMDLVFTVGQYNLVSMALNTLGVQLDEGIPGFPE